MYVYTHTMEYYSAMKKNRILELLLWLSRLRIQHSIYDDTGLSPGLTQWVKDLALLQAVT